MKETRVQNTIWEWAKHRISLASESALVNVMYDNGTIVENIPVLHRDIFLRDVDWPRVVDVSMSSTDMTHSDVFKSLVEAYPFENITQVFSLYEKFGFYKLVKSVGFLGENLKDGMCSVMEDGSVLVFDEIVKEKFDSSSVQSKDDTFLLENGMYDIDGESLVDFLPYGKMDIILEII